jgi:hypothetical protein
MYQPSAWEPTARRYVSSERSRLHSQEFFVHFSLSASLVRPVRIFSPTGFVAAQAGELKVINRLNGMRDSFGVHHEVWFDGAKQFEGAALAEQAFHPLSEDVLYVSCACVAAVTLLDAESIGLQFAEPPLHALQRRLMLLVRRGGVPQVVAAE